jgi:hypothetical protein
MIILQIYKEKKTRYICYRRARNIIIIVVTVVIGKAFCRSIESRHVTKKKKKTNRGRKIGYDYLKRKTENETKKLQIECDYELVEWMVAYCFIV